MLARIFATRHTCLLRHPMLAFPYFPPSEIQVRRRKGVLSVSQYS